METENEFSIKSVAPCFCFLCGTKLQEIGMGWLLCSNKECDEVFLPFRDVDGYQNLQLLKELKVTDQNG